MKFLMMCLLSSFLLPFYAQADEKCENKPILRGLTAEKTSEDFNGCVVYNAKAKINGEELFISGDAQLACRAFGLPAGRTSSFNLTYESVNYPNYPIEKTLAILPLNSTTSPLFAKSFKDKDTNETVMIGIVLINKSSLILKSALFCSF